MTIYTLLIKWLPKSKPISEIPHPISCSSIPKVSWPGIYRPYFFLYGICIMEENGRTERYGASRSFRTGSEFLTNKLIDEISQGGCNQYRPVVQRKQKPKAGEMEVVMAAGKSGILAP